VNSNSVSPARLAAFEILRRVEAGAYASVLLAARAAELTPLDRALSHELVLGVLRRQLWLDQLIELYANRRVAELDRAVAIILRLGLYQLRFLTRVPASAAVNESVNLVSIARKRSAGGLVNAVLRRATREPDVDPTSNIPDPIERLAIETSHPRWLLERWIKGIGAAEAAAFARANNEPAPVAFRVVNQRARAPEVLERLQQAGAEVAQSAIAPHAWRVNGAGKVLGELVSAGQIYLQDEASQLVAEVVNAQPGDRVLDVCAAPGGKTTLIAERAGDHAHIQAMDVSPRRLATIERTIQLHQLKSIKLMLGDAGVPLPFDSQSFDRVLLDAPCSGTGTLRHNPEIRWRLTNNDIPTLAEQQKRFLGHAAKVVKPGGLLVYSTCSVEVEENEDVIRNFLTSNDEFRQLRVSVSAELLTSSGAARTWPHRDGTDGFFVAALEKQG